LLGGRQPGAHPYHNHPEVEHPVISTAGDVREGLNLDEHTWQLMKAAMEVDDLPHGYWLRAAVRKKLERNAEDDGY
jgi:hypothetical protein